jgi:copper(I)-binding protein
MRKVGPIDLTPEAPLVLEPGGLHVMLTGLRGQLAAGTHHTLTLVFEHAGRVSVDVEVRRP